MESSFERNDASQNSLDREMMDDVEDDVEWAGSVETTPTHELDQSRVQLYSEMPTMSLAEMLGILNDPRDVDSVSSCGRP